MAALNVAIPDELIKAAVLVIVKKLNLVPANDKRARKISLDKFRKEYCINHSKTWVRNLIFDRYPETWDENGGWVINPSGHEPGIRGTWIRQEQAAKWLEKHDREIDWNERLAK